MTINDFVKEITELFEIEEELSLQSNLKEYEEYDSMAIMTLVAFIHKNFGKRFDAKQFIEINTIQSLIDLIGNENFTEL